MKRLLLCSAILLSLAGPVSANEPKGAPADTTENVLAVFVDGREAIGTAFMRQSEDGDVWLEADDWKQLDGLNLDLEGKTGLISARSLGLEPEFLPDEQAINLKVRADLRPDQKLGYVQKRVLKADPQPKGVFMNYDLAVRRDEGGKLATSIGHEARIGIGQATLRSWGQLTKTGGNGVAYARGNTTLQWDDLKRGVKWEAGDVLSTRNNFGGSTPLGGFRVGSDRYLRHDQNYQAVPLFSGLAEGASTAEIFVDGTKQGQYAIKPGPWHGNSFSVRPGSNAVSMVVRDEFGREHTLTRSFYYTTESLPKGASEWEVAGGLIRKDGNYKAPALTGRYVRGLSDTWTAGGTVEATADARSVTLNNRIAHPKLGALAIDTALSQSPAGSGHAGSVSWEYTARNWFANAGVTRYSDGFWTLSRNDLDPRFDRPDQKLTGSQSIAFSLSPRGSGWNAGLGASQLDYADGSTRSRVEAMFGVRKKSFDLGVAVGHSEDEGRTLRLSIGRELGKSVRAQASANHAEKSATRTADLMLNGNGTVAGRGVQWMAGAREPSARGNSQWATATAQDRFGELTLSAEHSPAGTGVNARLLGSVWAGEGGVTFQRPTYNSFAVVNVGDIKGIPVGNGVWSYKTNSRGVAVLPELYPLQPSTVTLDTSNLDIGVVLEDVSADVVPRRAAGAKLDFEIKSNNMVEVRVMRDGEPVPSPAVLSDGTEEAPVGEGGLAVLMDAAPGKQYRLDAGEGKSTCSITLPGKLPTIDETLTLECKETK